MISPFFSPTIGVLTLGIEQMVCPYLPDFALLFYTLWLCMDAIPTIPKKGKQKRNGKKAPYRFWLLSAKRSQ